MSSVRAFHTVAKCQASGVKHKLSVFSNSEKLLRRTDKESKSKKRTIDSRKHRKMLNAYPKQKVQHILHTKEDIGPQFLGDTEFLKQNLDKRAKYAILGTNGKQIQDSLLVAKDTKKFLAKGQLEKAVHLVRLAPGDKGIVGMNEIIRYFVEKGDVKGAIDLFQWRKKWGIPPNDHTYTILFNIPKCELSKTQAERLFRIATTSDLNIIQFNSALNALMQCDDQCQIALKLFDARPESLKLDNITYTILFNGIAKLKDEQSAVMKASLVGEAVAKSLSPRMIDTRLMMAYVKCFSSRVNPRYQAFAVRLMQNLFSGTPQFSPHVSTLLQRKYADVDLPSIPSFKVRGATSIVFTHMIEILHRIGSIKECKITFEQCPSKFKDVNVYIAWLKVLQQTKMDTSVLSVYKEANDVLAGDISRLEVETWKGLRKEIARGKSNFDDIQEFLKLGSGLVWQNWQFYMSAISQITLNPTQVSLVLEQFTDSAVDITLDKVSADKIKYISLEMVRLLQPYLNSKVKDFKKLLVDIVGEIEKNNLEAGTIKLNALKNHEVLEYVKSNAFQLKSIDGNK